VTAVPDDATALSHRDANYLFHPISVWEDAADDEPVIAASRAFADAIRPFSTGDPFLQLQSGDSHSVRRTPAARGLRL
jgi:hypothetical protein